MAWQEELRPASFRGIPFFVVASEASFGQRASTHLFPGRDKPYEEPLGRRQRQFSVEGYVVGPDYLRDKDRIIAACESSAPGELVHPYYGTRQVICREITVSESLQRGGQARFRFTFAEAGELRFPQVSDEPLAALESAGDAASEAAAGEFTDKFSISGATGFVQDSARGKVGEFREFMEARSSGLSQTTDDITDLSFALRQLDADIEDVIAQPGLLQDRLKNAIGLLASSASDFGELFGQSKKAVDFGSSDQIITQFSTPSRVSKRQNEDVFNRYVRTEFMIEGAKALAQSEPISFDESVEDRQFIIDELETLQEESDDDTVYETLQDLKVQIIEAIPGDERNLPRLVKFRNIATRSSLSLAYQLYGDLGNEQDLIDRNNIEHPGFIPGSTDLEVLSDS